MPADLASASPTTRIGAIDWPDAGEGAREFFVTLMAILAIGLGWAAVEAGRLGADLDRAPVSDGGSRYDDARSPGS